MEQDSSLAESDESSSLPGATVANTAPGGKSQEGDDVAMDEMIELQEPYKVRRAHYHTS